MGTKTIEIKKEVYDRLAAEKREDESCTGTIDRLIETALGLAASIRSVLR